MKLKYTFALLLACSAWQLNAQLHYGFKTGLNFARFDGPSETDNAGKSLENWKNVTGFHIGVSFSYSFTDNFGLRGELLYSKRGAKYTYDGQSHSLFNLPNGNTLTGSSRYLISINNAYVDLPIMAYGRFGDFELSGGGYVGLLIQSVGDGSLTYSDGTNQNLAFNLRYNYRKDDPGGSEGGTEKVIATLDGRQVELPKTIGAYYEYPEDRGHLYRTLDYGLVGGLSYYFSHALYFGARLQYGLADITNNRADLQHTNTELGKLVYRTDKDRNFMWQLSVGFGF
ncbi:MAG: porin family protein [Saprospiraceae bacterium]